MKHRPPLFRFLGLLLLGAVITLWARSFRHADGVALFDGAGHLNGVASDRGTLLLFASKIPFGREKAWSAETASATGEEIRTFDQVLYAKEALKFKFAGAKVCRGDVVAVDAAPPAPAVTWPFSAVTVPDWLLVAVLLVPTARWLAPRLGPPAAGAPRLVPRMRLRPPRHRGPLPGMRGGGGRGGGMNAMRRCERTGALNVGRRGLGSRGLRSDRSSPFSGWPAGPHGDGRPSSPLPLEKGVDRRGTEGGEIPESVAVTKVPGPRAAPRANR